MNSSGIALPPSHTQLFWLLPAPFVYFAICVAALAALSAACQYSWTRQNAALLGLWKQESMAVKEADKEESMAGKEAGSKRQVKLIEARDPVIALHGGVIVGAGRICLLVVLGALVGVLRMTILPGTDGCLESVFAKLMMLSLWVLLVAIVFAVRAVIVWG